MLLLLLFAFIAGLVTILSPCILPVLPIVLSGAVGDKHRPLGVVIGFVASFTFFTLFLSGLVKLFGIPSDSLRIVAIVILAFFGVSLLIPAAQQLTEKLFTKLSGLLPVNSGKTGLWGGILVGFSLGLVWTPCVGPILASVIALAIAGTVNTQVFLITLFYAMGTAIPMFMVMTWGRLVIKRTDLIQKVFGLLMILTALAMFLNWDRQFQTWVTNTFPNYGTNLTKFEQKAVTLTQASQGTAPELIAGGQWFGSAPLTINSLRDKVVLVDFWTYTCINCIRTLPYMKMWDKKYRDHGLVIIGVHTPEFEFEKQPANVARAVKDFGLTYPVMQDNDYATWNAYHNQYWPAKYLIDNNGNIVFTHFGEGDYDRVETEIQKALGIKMDIANPSYTVDTQTPETYVGAMRKVPGSFDTTGTWDIQPEYAQSPKGGTLTLPFVAKNVYLVMKTSNNKSGHLKVFIDGKLNQTLTVFENKLYNLVSLNLAGPHTLKLEFLDENIQLFAFTFG